MENKEKKSTLEKHALGRLDKVEKEHRKVYEKKKNPVSFWQIIMILILVIIVLSMIIR